jgi:hypothetical protein
MYTYIIRNMQIAVKHEACTIILIFLTIYLAFATELVLQQFLRYLT